MTGHARELDQIRQFGRKPTGRFMPQIVKAQIDQEVFLRRDLRYVAIYQVFQPRTLQTFTNALLSASAVVGKTRPHSERGKSLSN